MYEPIRTKSVHTTMAGPTSDFPHRSREEELDIQLAGHLAALLAVTDELCALTPSTDLDTAAERLAAQVSRLRGGRTPLRATPDPAPAGDPAALHRRAHALAGRALVVAASRADTAAAILAAERMDAHTAALADPKELSAAH
ncbi:SCO4983 family protein [Streptomyces sp. NPDC001606]